MILKKSKKIYLYLLLHFFLLGCYSFRGANLDSRLKTLQIINFTVQTAGVPSGLSLKFNEKIREYYLSNTSLKLNNQNPDLVLEGAIIGYELSPQAPTSSDKAGLNRLTVKIQVKFTNNKNEEKNFDQEFSFFRDFPQNNTLSSVEEELYPKILDQIVLDIFNKTSGEW